MTHASLGSLHDGVRRSLSRRALVVACAWTGLVVATALVAAWVMAGPDGWQPGARGPLLVDLALGSAATVALVLGRRWWRLRLADGSVARAMEDAARLPQGVVQGGLELSRGIPPGVSAALAERGERDLLARLDLPPSRLGGALGREVDRWARRGLGGLALLLPVLAVLLVATPVRTSSAWTGLGAPLTLLATPSLPPLGVEPGTLEVPRGSPVQVRIDASGRERVTLHWQTAGEIARTAELPVVDGRAGHGLDEVTAAVEYWVAAPDGARTPVHTLTPVDPLFVSDVVVRLVFPEYTGRAQEEYRGDVPPLEVPAGTRIQVDGRGSRTLSSARLVPAADDADEAEGAGGAAAGEAVALETRGAAFQGSFVPRGAVRYAWAFLDADGAPAALVPGELQVTVLPDLPPSVAITLPARDTILPLSLRQPLVVQAADDHGVRDLELVAWRVTALGEALAPVRTATDLGGMAGVLARPLLDVTGWGLLPGDEVRYYARVRDNGPWAQEARTEEHVLRMPDAAALRRGAQEEMDRAAAELETLARQAEESAEETRTMERQARAPDRTDAAERFRSGEAAQNELGFEEREALGRALEEQEAMAARVDSLRQELGQLSRTLQDAGARDPELGRDLQELQDLLNEVTTPDMQARLQELSERLQEMDRTRAQETLEELADREEAFRQRLDEALDRMKRAAAQQDFRATASEAQELADQEQALAEAMATEEDPSARADQQEALQDRAAEMEARMERLGERLDELGEESAALGVEEARAQARQAMENMSSAAQQARAQQGRQAGEQASQASQQLDEAARQLQEAQQRMMEQRAAALQQALGQTAQDALSLARRQGELRESMRGASPEEMAGLRADVSAVEQGVRNMAENLSVATRAAGAQGAEREVGSALGQAMGALDETVSALDGPASASRSPGGAADRAVEALNQVALQAMAASARMSQGGEGAGTPEEMMEALERLAQQQADVNNQASQMMPMQLSPQAMQQQMQQMAQGQQSVASELGDLSDQEGQGPLGDLQALAQEAEALARELAQGRLAPETRQRQERLFHRLLDAGRSLEKEEYSDERESEAAGAFQREAVAPVSRDALGLLRFRGPDAEALRRLPPAARTLVLQYFQRLNQRGGGEPPPEAP